MSAAQPTHAKPPAKLRAALERVPLQGKRVLEPASGPGLYLAHFGPGSLGLDNSAEAIAKASASGLTVRPCDLDQPEWSYGLQHDEPFEAAWLCDVLMHVADPVAFLAVLPRTVQPGAPLLFIEWTLPDKGPLLGLRSFLARRLPGATMVLDEPTHLRFFRPAELEALLVSAGYEIEDRWLHSFHGLPGATLLSWLVSSFWPVRTLLARVPKANG